MFDAENRPRVLVCEDHALFRRAVVTSLEEADFDVVAEATTGAEAIERARDHTPDLVLMDLRMPEVDGAEAIAVISASRPWTRILVLTVSDDLDEIIGAIRAGAIGHLRKEEAMKVLPDVAQEVIDGGVHIGASLARRVRHELGRLTDPFAGFGGHSWKPTDAQLQLVAELADGSDLTAAAQIAGIPEWAARTELRGAIEGLHQAARLAAAG